MEDNRWFMHSRYDLKLTQKQLADLMGMSLKQVSNIENGITPIRRVHVFALRWLAYADYSKHLPYEYQEDAFNG